MTDGGARTPQAQEGRELGSQDVVGTDAVQKVPGARILVLRGVAWRADAVEPLRLWQGLVRFWPAQLAGEGRGASILAHSGALPPCKFGPRPLPFCHLGSWCGRLGVEGGGEGVKRVGTHSADRGLQEQ